MSRVEKIESQIGELSSAELAAFREWFVEFDACAWNRQFEADVKAGKLDSLAEKARGHRTSIVSAVISSCCRVGPTKGAQRISDHPLKTP